MKLWVCGLVRVNSVIVSLIAGGISGLAQNLFPVCVWLDVGLLVCEPVGEVEDDKDGRRDPHGPQVDIVARLLDLRADALLKIHLGQGGLRGGSVGKQQRGEKEKKRNKK